MFSAGPREIYSIDRMSEPRHRRVRCLLALGTVLSGLLLAGLPAAVALDPDRRISQYGHIVWPIQDGDISSPTNIAQTTEGFLWVTTAHRQAAGQRDGAGSCIRPRPGLLGF